MYFIAIQYARVPAFRPWILKTAEKIHGAHILKALASPKSWQRALKKAGFPADRAAASYEKMKRDYIKPGAISLSGENEWFLLRGFQAADSIIPLLASRYWGVVLSSSGSFIGSDNPVVMDGPKDSMIGFCSADILQFPVNRHVLLYGTNQPMWPRVVNRKLIARHNTMTMLAADEHVYSPAPDFCWLDEAGKDQTDRKLFSREKILAGPAKLESQVTGS